MHPIEEALVQAFVAPHKRSRWLLLLNSPKRRRKFLDCLNHCADLDPRYAQPIPSNADVVALLRSHGAPASCYVISDDGSIDGREMPIAEAVTAAELCGWGTIVSCVPGKLAYYYDESGARRSLLMRANA